MPLDAKPRRNVPLLERVIDGEEISQRHRAGFSARGNRIK
jgi:hypothetical protein